MTTFPNSPRLIKGAIVGIDIFNPLASIIVFQYNPDTLQRKLTPRMGRVEGDPAEVTRLEGAPEEIISLQAELDATDQLEQGDNIAAKLGIYPQLSALEMLIYPKSSYMIAKTALSLAGVMEMDPPQAPMTFLVWSYKRVLPVRVTGFTIEEEAFDAKLNPIRASVSLSLRVLSYSDFRFRDPGYWVFMAHHLTKESMATIPPVRPVVSSIKDFLTKEVEGSELQF